MKLEFNFERSDWMEFQKNYLEQSKQFQRLRLIATWLFPGIMMAIVLIETMIGNFNTIGATILFVVAILWMIFYPKHFLNQTLKKSAKLLDDPANDGYLGLHQIEFREDVIIHRSPEAETTIKWIGIKKLSENDQYYFLYNTSASALIIPKNKLEISDSEREELDELIKTNINELNLK